MHRICPPCAARLAHLLDGLGLPRAVLAARARELFPWRWLTVLTYHRISDTLAPGYDPEVVDAPAAAFESQVKLLQRYFTLIDTRDLDAWRAGGRLPPNPAMITFDDGYRDNHDVVLPILRRLSAKAVFFVATLYIADRRVFWWELVNHALTLSPRRQRLRLRYPEPLELELATPADRRASVRTLLVLLKRELGVDMERFLAELYAASGSAHGPRGRAAPGRRPADELGPRPRPDRRGLRRAVALARPPGAAHAAARGGRRRPAALARRSWSRPSTSR